MVESDIARAGNDEMAASKANLAASKAVKAAKASSRTTSVEATLASLRLERSCGTCGARTKPNGKPPDVCQGCLQAFFCSRACINEAWPSHQEACEAAQREREAEAEAAEATKEASSTEPRSDGASTSRGTT
jgi:hypothetical protein